MNYWLIKSEPDVFGIEHLKATPNQSEHWGGVRNYQARNMMRDEMKIGDLVLFYHSSTAVPGIVGIAEVIKEAYADFSAWENPESPYYDPKSPQHDPRWFMVDIKFVRDLKRIISLKELKTHSESLRGLTLIRKGNRLSIMPISAEHWQLILAME